MKPTEAKTLKELKEALKEQAARFCPEQKVGEAGWHLDLPEGIDDQILHLPKLAEKATLCFFEYRTVEGFARPKMELGQKTYNVKTKELEL